MKATLKSIGVMVGFLLIQVISIILAFALRLVTNIEWYYEFNDIIETYGPMSPQYIAGLSSLCYEALLISDCIILIIMIIYTRVKKIKVIKKLDAKTTFLLVNIGIVVNFITSFIVSILPQTSITSEYDELLGIVMEQKLIVVIIVTGIIAPIVEELLFRFAIINLFKSKSLKAGVIVSALMFGIAHMNLIQSTYAFFIGLILAYIYISDFNLLKSIIVHMTINTTSVIFEYVNEGIQVVMIMASILSTMYLIYYLKK